MSAWYLDAAQGWDPRLYELWFRRNPVQALIRRREQEAAWAALAPVLDARASVLEVGAGTGAYSLQLARRCRRVTAVDPAPEMLAWLRIRAREQGIENLRTVAGSLPHELPGSGHDGAVTFGVLNYVPDLAAALDALARAVIGGGWVVLNMPAATPGARLYAVGERLTRRRVWLRSPDDLLAAADAAGLSVEALSTAGISRRGFLLVSRLRVPPR